MLPADAGQERSTKWLCNAQNVLEEMKRMLDVLCEAVEWEKLVVKRLQVVGVVCVGLKMQVIRMGYWGEGSVAVVSRETIAELPIAGGEMEGLFSALAMVASNMVSYPVHSRSPI